MPDLEWDGHLKMLAEFEARRRQDAGRIYGLHWGDPNARPDLRAIRDRFVLPFVAADRTAVEIGPGGGRWTQFLLGFRRLYVVDLHAELLDELRKGFDRDNMVFVRNHGTDFPGIPAQSVDYVFTFGTFVHLDLAIIDAYLANLRQVVKPDADVCIQYSDKTKPAARANQGFSDNDPQRMRALVRRHGYEVAGEDTDSLEHSNVIHVRPGTHGGAPLPPARSL